MCIDGIFDGKHDRIIRSSHFQLMMTHLKLRAVDVLCEHLIRSADDRLYHINQTFLSKQRTRNSRNFEERNTEVSQGYNRSCFSAPRCGTSLEEIEGKNVLWLAQYTNVEIQMRH
jgi:hypothetical protein